jgi:hypothetical protein
MDDHAQFSLEDADISPPDGRYLPERGDFLTYAGSSPSHGVTGICLHTTGGDKPFGYDLTVQDSG